MGLFTENCCKVMFKARARHAQGPRKARARPRPRPVLKKTSVSQMIDLVMTIQTVQESSKSELSSRFLSTSKFGPPRKTSAQGHARLFAQGQGWLIFSINYCNRRMKGLGERSEPRPAGKFSGSGGSARGFAGDGGGAS